MHPPPLLHHPTRNRRFVLLACLPVRPAVTMQYQLADITYAQTKDASYPGLVSKGFSNLALVACCLMLPVLPALKTHFYAADMTYVQTKDASYPGLVSKGFSFGAALLWPALESILLKEVVQGGVTDVTISGHSLGAALATLLAYRAQVSWWTLWNVLRHAKAAWFHR